MVAKFIENGQEVAYTHYEMGAHYECDYITCVIYGYARIDGKLKSNGDDPVKVQNTYQIINSYIDNAERNKIIFEIEKLTSSKGAI